MPTPWLLWGRPSSSCADLTWNETIKTVRSKHPRACFGPTTTVKLASNPCGIILPSHRAKTKCTKKLRESGVDWYGLQSFLPEKSANHICKSFHTPSICFLFGCEVLGQKNSQNCKLAREFFSFPMPFF